MYKHKAENSTNDRGGFLGLVKFLAKKNHKDINAIYSETEGRLVFKIFIMLVKMTEATREEMMICQKELFDAYELNDHGNGMDV